MRIYLIRHGETDWNVQGRLQGREDIALNERGIEQATLCGKAFLDKKIDAIITSPLIRAKRTAEIIAGIIDKGWVSSKNSEENNTAGKISSTDTVNPTDNIGIKNRISVIVDEALIERDFGKLSGLTYDKKKYFDTFGRDEYIESWDELCQRMLDCIKKYAQIYSDKDIIMISHGAAINAVVTSLSHGEAGSGKTRLKNACINIIRYEQGLLMLDLFNLTANEFMQLNA